jgi:hypothetical protein
MTTKQRHLISFCGVVIRFKDARFVGAVCVWIGHYSNWLLRLHDWHVGS